MERKLDIGAGHTLTFAHYQGEVAGCSIAHPRPDDGMPCDGWIAFEGRAWARSFEGITAWKVESEEPLTLSPSVLCRTCGDHGFVRGGKWVRARCR